MHPDISRLNRKRLMADCRRLFVVLLAAVSAVYLSMFGFLKKTNTGLQGAAQLTARSVHSYDEHDNTPAQAMQDEVTQPSPSVIYTERRQRIERECSRLSNTHRRASPEHRLIVATKHHNITFCLNPKAASSSLTTIMTRLFGHADSLTQVHPITHKNVVLHLIRFSRVGRSVRAKLLSGSSLTFMFTREPLDRLVSAFNNKIRDRNPDYQELRHKILRRNKKPRSADVSFREFVDYIMAFRGDMDWHWRPQHEVCRPCAIHYDFIGRYETLATDSAALLRIVYPKHNVSLELKNPSKARSRSDADARLVSLYKTLSASQIHQLLQLYATDYRLFGYEKPAFIDSILSQNFTI